MTKRFPPSLAALVEELKKLPGIGQKNATRLAFHLLGVPRERAEALARAIVEVREKVGNCQRCYNLAEEELCGICRDPSRTGSVLCVVESARDVLAVEGTGHFRGRYHVLSGVLSPMRGIGPEDLRVRELIERVGAEGVREVIVATNLDVEGEATASYLGTALRPAGVKVTRIARGIPIGGSLEHADLVTLGMALDGRSEL